MTSLAESIAALTNPTPKVLDPEDDVNIETVAKFDRIQDDSSQSSYGVSELRIKTAPLLEDVDPDYTGKKISRKSLGAAFQNDKTVIKSRRDISSSQEDYDDRDSTDEDEAYDDDINDSDLEKFKNSFKNQISSDNENDPDDEDDDGDVDDEDDVDEEDESESDVEDNSSNTINKFSNIDVSGEIEKGQAVKNQQELFNRLCKCRIKLQKLLTIANRLPQNNCWEILKQKGGKDIAECINKGSNSAKVLLNNCLNLQSELLKQNPEATVINSQNQNKINNGDEEIPSDTDDEMEEADQKEKHEEPDQKILKRKLNCEEYSDILSKRHKSIIPYRNSVIQKFFEKTRLASGRITQKSFSALDSSPLQQIEQILQDENRLIKRTQLKRSLYRVLGKPDAPEVENTENIETNENVTKQDAHLKDYDPEIFDDDDFYRQLLKEVIESKSVGIDPAVLRKQMEIQSVRNRMKKKVDTKASKGRKIRYDVHPKLVNFMAPIETSTISDEARDNLLKCIFGRSTS